MKSDNTRRGEELADRLARYAGRVIAVTRQLPDTREGKHVRDQLLRCATAPGAHYAEARSAQSTADFVHKTALAAKEARESVHWLKTVNYAGLGKANESVVDEGEQVTAILTASTQTARKRLKTG